MISKICLIICILCTVFSIAAAVHTVNKMDSTTFINKKFIVLDKTNINRYFSLVLQDEEGNITDEIVSHAKYYQAKIGEPIILKIQNKDLMISEFIKLIAATVCAILFWSCIMYICLRYY